MKNRFVLPSIVVGKARVAGKAGLEWLDNIDVLVEEIERIWNIRVTETLRGGSHAFVGSTIDTDGMQLVLKVEIPDVEERDFLRAVRVLQAADGNGYAKVYACDAKRRAILMERLGGTMRETDIPAQRQMEIICAALMQTWKLHFDGGYMPDGADSIAWFRAFILQTWKELGQPCPETVIAQAMRFLDSREERMDRENWVLLHGDAHNNNMLRVPGTQDCFKLVDPEGVFYEKEYDLGVLMREWPEEYTNEPLRKGRERMRFLCDLTGADEQGVWEWGFLQIVSTALVLIQIGEEELGVQMLSTAQSWCE